jgi:hypothetical protein
MKNMANSYQIMEDRKFESLSSLKKHFRESKRTIQETRVGKIIATGGAGASIEIEESATITISQIGKTEITLVGAMSANDNYYDGAIVTAVYTNAAGTQATATCTINTTDSTTEVAFVVGATPVTDCYQILSLVSSKATQAAETFGCGSTGALTLGVISAESTTATAANLHGVGDIYVRGMDDSASMQAKIYYLDYITPWGLLKHAMATTAANSTTEIRFFEATYSKSGNTETYTATTTYVGDFYRIRRFWTASTPASGKYVILTDADCGNVDGSSNDVYGAIEEGFYYSVNSRYMTRDETYVENYLVSIFAEYPVAAESCTLTITFTPFGQTETSMAFVLLGQYPFTWTPMIKLEPATEVTFIVVDDAAAGGNLTFESCIVEVGAKP